MRTHNTGRLLLVFIAFATLHLHSAHAVDLAGLMREGRQSSLEGGELASVGWLPRELWIQPGQDESQFPADVRMYARTATEYLLFLVAVGRNEDNGTFTSRPGEEIRTSLKLHAPDGKVYLPLPRDQIPADLQESLDRLKPAFQRLLGTLGEGIDIVVFTGKANGARVVDPLRAGKFSIEVAGRTFAWRLPFGSLMPPVFDPRTQETFPGNYKFNPFTGDKLKAKPE